MRFKPKLKDRSKIECVFISSKWFSQFMKSHFQFGWMELFLCSISMPKYVMRRLSQTCAGTAHAQDAIEIKHLFLLNKNMKIQHFFLMWTAQVSKELTFCPTFVPFNRNARLNGWGGRWPRYDYYLLNAVSPLSTHLLSCSFVFYRNEFPSFARVMRSDSFGEYRWRNHTTYLLAINVNVYVRTH